MHNTKTTLISLLSAAVLTACGGGGSDGASTDARTKYVGTWQSECSIASWVPGAGPRYEREKTDIRLKGDSDLAVISTYVLFLDSACTQPATGETSDPDQATLTFVGSTKNLTDGKVVDKVRAALPDLAPNTTVPGVLYTLDNKLYFQANDPDRPVPVDSEGFPDALDLADFLTRVSN